MEQVKSIDGIFSGSSQYSVEYQGFVMHLLSRTVQEIKKNREMEISQRRKIIADSVAGYRRAMEEYRRVSGRYF